MTSNVHVVVQKIAIRFCRLCGGLPRPFVQKLRNITVHLKKNEPSHDKTNKMVCVPSQDSDQLVHLPSLIRVFAVRLKKPWVLSYRLIAQWRLWSVFPGHTSFCWFCRLICETCGSILNVVIWSHLYFPKRLECHHLISAQRSLQICLNVCMCYEDLRLAYASACHCSHEEALVPWVHIKDW